MILILLFHFSVCSSSVQASPCSMNKVLAHAVGSWGLMGVHCFFFISAWFLQRREKNFNAVKLLTILFQLVFYSLLVLTLGKLTGILTISLSTITKSLLFWYITAYCIMYLLSPFLNKFINTCSADTLKKLVLLLTIFFPLQLFLLSAFIHPLTGMSDAGLVVYDYLLIGYLRKNENNFFERNRYTGAVLTFLTVILLESALLYFTNNAEFILRFTHRYSIVQILLALFVFYIFKNLDFQVKFINSLAKCTLAVYILHDGPLADYIKSHLFRLDTMFAESYYVVYLLFTVITVYLACAGIDYFRSLIYNQFMNRFNPYISHVNQRINNWFNTI